MLGEESSTPSPEAVLPQGAAYRFEDGALRMSLALDLYSLDAIRRSCYWLTDRCYVFLSRQREDVVDVTLLPKTAPANADAIAWTFLNDLLDQQLRIDIGRETAQIREMIVAQAFADVDIIDHQGRPVGASDQGVDPPVRTWRPVS